MQRGPAASGEGPALGAGAKWLPESQGQGTGSVHGVPPFPEEGAKTPGRGKGSRERKQRLVTHRRWPGRGAEDKGTAQERGKLAWPFSKSMTPGVKVMGDMTSGTQPTRRRLGGECRTEQAQDSTASAPLGLRVSMRDRGHRWPLRTAHPHASALLEVEGRTEPQASQSVPQPP